MAPRHLVKKRSPSLTNSLVIASIAVAFVAIVAALAVQLFDGRPTVAREGARVLSLIHISEPTRR